MSPSLSLSSRTTLPAGSLAASRRCWATARRPMLPAVAATAPGREPAFPAAAAAASLDPLQAASASAGAAWDPDGLLPPPPSEGHFARRARQRAEASGEAPPPSQLRPVPPEHLTTGGIPAADASLYDRAAFQAQLAQRFLPIDLDTPGLRILHFDPPIFSLPDFFSGAECDDAVATATAASPPLLEPSKVGSGNLRAAAPGSARRTSSSALVDTAAQAAHPRLGALAAALQSRGQRLLGQQGGGGAAAPWGPQGRLPLPGQYCHEMLQLARYEKGQHFLAHEDGFPAGLAAENGFQRHATLLLYLNSPPAGGATRFDQLGLAVRPAQGTLLLFFPAFADGAADPRTLHTAEDAVDCKWVMQQWVARGLAGAAVDPIAAALAGILPQACGGGIASAAAGQQQPGEQQQQPQKSSRGKKTGSKKTASNKGFGA